MNMDLSIVTTVELVAELFKRHDATLVVRCTKRTPHVDLVEHSWNGGVSACIGLAEIARDRLLAVDREAQRAG